MSRLSVAKERIKIVLCEGVSSATDEALAAQGYTSIVRVDGAPDSDALRNVLEDTHILGIRSRTQVTGDVLAHADRLFCIGCFCIGTDQVDLAAAKQRGVAVFNAPYSNTRSVAELVLGEMIMLLRRVPEKSAAAHEGRWLKSAAGSNEIRGRTLGIVGYGHIGSQLSILAESLGMQVIYFDIADKLTLGNAKPVTSLNELLRSADVVSLHVPDTLETRDMIGPDELGLMKPGAILLNAARGRVVAIEALGDALKSGHIGGAAVDVFPSEPKGANVALETPLRGLANVILTPHIGGSTEEAQHRIGQEVAERMIRYSDTGSTAGSVNLVEVALPPQQGATRFLHIHRNVPGVLSRINDVFSARHLNIAGQYLRTDADIGYVVSDINGRIDEGMGIRRALEEIDGTIRVRFLY
jgi:D-3-phosphoglycerate dehydrogenase